MKKIIYLQPAVEVVRLEVSCDILSASDGRSYGTANSGVPAGELSQDGEWLWN